MVEWRRETKRIRYEIFSEMLLLLSAFVRLVQVHLHAPNYLSFSLLLDFRESRVGYIVHQFFFNSLLYFCKSRQGHFKILKDSPHFSILASLLQLRLSSASQPSAVCRKASTQSDVTSSSSSAGNLLRFLLVFFWVEIFHGLYNFQDVHAIHMFTPAANK